MGQLFGTDGIRGKANEYPVTPEMALKLGRAVARVLQVPGVVIGRDTRLSGEMLESGLTAGLVSEGVDVFLAGVVPTPAVAMAVKNGEGFMAGVMLTASHNPAEDNGLKVFGSDGYKLTDEQEARVEEILLTEDLAVPSAAEGELGRILRTREVYELYCERVREAFPELNLKGLKVVLDCANGAAWEAGPELLKAFGAELEVLSGEDDGGKINLECGAMHPERAAEKVTASGADLGISFDGDADRVIFSDAEGKVINGDRVLCLCAQALEEQGALKNKTLVATVMSNLGLKDTLEASGLKLETTGVGDRLVLERMRAGGFNLGGENSGHVIFSDLASTGDGIVCALMVLTFMKKSGKSLAELADCMREYPQVLTNLMVREKPPVEEVPALMKAIRAAEKELGESGRTLVRYSGTEKKMRVLVEARDGEMAERLCAGIVAAAQTSIGL